MATNSICSTAKMTVFTKWYQNDYILSFRGRHQGGKIPSFREANKEVVSLSKVVSLSNRQIKFGLPIQLKKKMSEYLWEIQ